MRMFSIYQSGNGEKLDEGYQVRNGKRSQSREEMATYSEGESADPPNAGLSASYSEGGDKVTMEVGIKGGWYSESSGGDTIYGGPPMRRENTNVLQQRIHHNLLYHAESSSSPESSPTKERKSFPRRSKSRPNRKEQEDGQIISVGPIQQPPPFTENLPIQLPVKRGYNLSRMHKDGAVQFQHKSCGPPAKPLRSAHASSENLIEMSEAECDRGMRTHIPKGSYVDSQVVKPSKKSLKMVPSGKDYSLAF